MKKYCLGIDIGGTSIKSGLFDRQGVLLEKWSIPTRIEENGKHIIGDIKNSTDRKLESLGLDPGQLSGAGVGVPGQVSRQGEVLFAENLGWYHVPLTEELTRRLGMPVRTENDANLAALGEMWKGSGSRCSNLLFVTLGTGIGCGIVADGRILTGAAGAAGEIVRENHTGAVGEIVGENHTGAERDRARKRRYAVVGKTSRGAKFYGLAAAASSETSGKESTFPRTGRRVWRNGGEKKTALAGRIYAKRGDAGGHFPGEESIFFFVSAQGGGRLEEEVCRIRIKKAFHDAAGRRGRRSVARRRRAFDTGRSFGWYGRYGCRRRGGFAGGRSAEASFLI